MDSFKDTVAFWASVLGTFLGLLGAIQSLSWLAALGGLMILTSISAVAYATHQRELVESAVLKVASRSIDSLNMAGLRRRRNRLVAGHVERSGIGRELARQRSFFPRLGRGGFAWREGVRGAAHGALSRRRRLRLE